MTKEEIEDYIQAVIEHAIQNVEYSNYFLSKIKTFAEKAEEECNKILLDSKRSVTKKQKNETEADIAEVLADFKIKVDDYVSAEMKKIAEREEVFLNEVVADALGVSFVVPATALSILAMVPIVSMGNAADFGQSVSDRMGKMYNSMMNQSYTFGEDYEDVLPEYENQFNTFRRGLNTEAETLGYSLSEEFDRIVFTKTKEPDLKYMWSAILDTTTCLVCGTLDHTIYEKISDVPMYPAHFACRCTLIPGNDEIFGQFPKSYEEWFEGQSDKTKLNILKETRYNLYKNGMRIRQFVNNGRMVPLKDLVKPIRTPREKLNIPESKLTGYALKQKDKAKVFESALGYNLDNYKELQENIYKEASKQGLELVRSTEYGTLYRCDIEMVGPNSKKAVVRTGWIMEKGSDSFRLTTAYVK